MTQFDDVHIIASTRGHLRIEMPRLYRSAALKAEIERAWSAHPGIIAARANPLTARILILFQPQLQAAALMAELGIAVHTPAPAKLAPAPAKAAPSARPRADAARRPLYAPWHAREADEALAFFDSSPARGLSSAEAALRLRQGKNIIAQAPPLSSLQILLNQFTSLPIVLLALSAGVAMLTGGVAEAAAIGAVLAMNGAIGFVTERRAESTVASLSELVDDIVLVLRDGNVIQVEAANVVPGDILVLKPGTRVAADLRLVEASSLMLDESALTGESFPVPKQTAVLQGKLPLAERGNMAYRGTAVAMGSGAGLVVGTGARTEAGAIQAITISAQRPPTPTQRQLDQLGRQLIKASSALCVAIFGIGVLRGINRLSMFKTAMSLAIAAVPEGLPAVATTSLARGIRRMRKHGVLIRHLHAVESIGAIQVICLDKTGTLTMNVMSAVAISTAERTIDPQQVDAQSLRSQPDLARLLQICVLCNQSGSPDGLAGSPLQGSATENALLALAARAGLQAESERHAFPLLEAALRAEGRNFMRTLHRRPDGGQALVAVKGSPDEVLSMCATCLGAHGERALGEVERSAILQQNQDMASRQLRVLGFAFAEGDLAQPLTWIGLIGLADPLRPGMQEVIARFHQAGIDTVMLTGDQAGTAYVIGKELQLSNGGQLNIVNAEQLDNVAPGELKALAAHAHIFSRVTPSDKLRIVQALQQAGRTVAMTGDGINDSPALRAADIGIAMGSGTGVALSAADIALKNDDLASVLDAVGQGRVISANIRKSVRFLFASNLSEILVVAGAVSAGLGQPLTPLQLLWLNLLTDVLPAIALAAERAEPEVMLGPARDPGLPMIGKQEFWRYGREGGALAAGTVGAYAWGVLRHGPGARAGTIAFDTLVLGQMLYAYFCRSERHRSFFDPALPPNRQLNLAVAASLGLQAAAHLLPGLRRLLGVAALGPADVLAIVAGAVGPLLLNELARPGSQSNTASTASAQRSANLPANLSASAAAASATMPAPSV